jgi:cell division protein ZapA (FtsZ GTPase activity inhibitor)
MDAPAEKTVVRVIIFQQPYTLRVSGEPGETEKLAEAVDTLMNQIAARGAGSDASRVAVLASLHLADKVRTLEKELDGLRDRLRSLDSRLSIVIEDENAETE